MPLLPVSFVVPVRNGEPWIRRSLDAILAQADGSQFEIVVVDDGSVDGSRAALREYCLRSDVRVIDGPCRGAAAALNAGIRAARYPVVCQVDQDVILDAGWLARVTPPLADPQVGAVQGYYRTDPEAPILARVTALDLELRYAAIPGDSTDHVCTGNAAYRREALVEVGLFDETLGYGYDNDMSYRLRAAGYLLLLCRQATSVHCWRDSLLSYCRQQYGFGYGRLDVVAKHPGRLTGDAVSPLGMMLHPLVTGVALTAVGTAGVLAFCGLPWAFALWLAALALCLVIGERTHAAVTAWRRHADPAAWLFPVIHLIRNVAWLAAIATWLTRRVAGILPTPAHSMAPRVPIGSVADPIAAPPEPRTLVVIPAHNEAGSLPSVLAELHQRRGDVDVLVIDDGSTDETKRVLEELSVRRLRFDRRVGIGCAMRAGFRIAHRAGYQAVIRLDGDGQHDASEIDALLRPIRSGEADVVLGSRYLSAGTAGGEREPPPRAKRVIVKLLGIWLSRVTGRPVTDPTSGFCAFGSRAIALLADLHPKGYPEPELHLIVSRHALAIQEVPVSVRPRLAGRTSLTPLRIAAAAGRLLMALLLEPVRPSIGANH